ncbi:uncharacterized protein LOC121999757 [Zingiber officinale]|uniref:Uncharacterized protein n=1 Tax=Zingiber officinale TaxID=94328 RepID=A0A8J5KXF4_ZINOF|nr:uncharacterized protein LOC121999757 [Zingiber officinale]KAG6494223.1 hypothetical protein ZIOFF_049242 [Zingiber officinale]
MESFNVDNYLPPRKRLLAELRRENLESDFLPPVPFLSGDLGARLRDVINSSVSTPEKIIEVSKSVALAASEIAVAARNTAIEKAAAATKAKADAKNALLLLDSTTMNKKIQKWLFDQRQIEEEADPNKAPEKRAGKAVGYNGDVCNENSHVFYAENMMKSNNSEGKISICCEIGNAEEEESDQHTKKQENESMIGSVAGSGKVRIRQKKLSLSQCNIRERVEMKKLTLSENLSSFTKESDLDSAGSNMSSDDAEVSPGGGASMQISTAWKCRKIKASQCSPKSKILKALC